MNEVATVALKCLVMILTTLITAVIIPYIRTRIGNDRWDKLREITEQAVRFAEQRYTPEQWKEKKEYVYKYILLKAEDFGLNLTEEDIDVLVEGVVHAVKKG